MAFWNSTSKTKARKPVVDWATANVEPDWQWMRHVEWNPLPDWLDVAERTIAASGRDPDTLNKIEVLLMVSRVAVGQIKSYMTKLGDAAGQADLDVLCGREDFTFQMLWNFLSQRGANGVAIINEVSKMLMSDQFTHMIANLIREGHADKPQAE